ncbi:MAG: hypothetical protein DRG78_02575, partial [Epsilonproteobacteria bacterium]
YNPSDKDYKLSKLNLDGDEWFTRKELKISAHYMERKIKYIVNLDKNFKKKYIVTIDTTKYYKKSELDKYNPSDKDYRFSQFNLDSDEWFTRKELNISWHCMTKKIKYIANFDKNFKKKYIVTIGNEHFYKKSELDKYEYT